MSNLKSPVKRDSLKMAAIVVGMVAHRIRHSEIKSEVRRGSFKSTVDIWIKCAHADRSLVERTLNTLARDPLKWDSVGKQGSAFYNQDLALEAVRTEFERERRELCAATPEVKRSVASRRL